MKHIRFFEKKLTAKSVKNMLIEYHNFLEEIKPIVIEKYKELAQDEYYDVPYGDTPNINNIDDLKLQEVGYWDKGVQFVLHEYDRDSAITGSYYIEVTDEELELMLLNIKTIKYNL